MPPVILHCFDYLNRGGTELGLCTLIREGFYQGCDLHLLALARGKGDGAADMASLVGPDRLHCLLERPELTESGHLHPALIAQAIDQLTATLKNIKAQTLVLSLPITQFAGRMAAMALPDLRVISFEHLAFANKQSEALRSTASRCAAVFGDTPETLTAMRHLYPSGIPEFHVPLTILTPGQPRQITAPASFNLLSMGRLDGQKNYAELLYALADLANEDHSFHLTIFGEGHERPNLENLARTLSLESRLSLPGFENDPANLAAARQAAHLYVQPSLAEGFCLSAAEAMAAGLIVVATHIGGLRDYGRDGENMIAIPAPTREAIAATLRQAMNSYASDAARLSAAALKTAQERFSREAVQRLWQPARSALLTA